MFTINLNKLQFFSFHGLYEEEKVLGGEYEVNLSLDLDEKGEVLKIQDTVNYEKIFTIVKQRMNIPTALLETVAQEIANLVCSSDNRIRKITVSVEKKNPPIANFQGSVSVSYIKDLK
jgi:7,8-dihydroneopterin aldolase/epimerase/oxygenase